MRLPKFLSLALLFALSVFVLLALLTHQHARHYKADEAKIEDAGKSEVDSKEIRFIGLAPTPENPSGRVKVLLPKPEVLLEDYPLVVVDVKRSNTNIGGYFQLADQQLPLLFSDDQELATLAKNLGYWRGSPTTLTLFFSQPGHALSAVAFSGLRIYRDTWQGRVVQVWDEAWRTGLLAARSINFLQSGAQTARNSKTVWLSGLCVLLAWAAYWYVRLRGPSARGQAAPRLAMLFLVLWVLNDFAWLKQQALQWPVTAKLYGGKTDAQKFSSDEFAAYHQAGQMLGKTRQTYFFVGSKDSPAFFATAYHAAPSLLLEAKLPLAKDALFIVAEDKPLYFDDANAEFKGKAAPKEGQKAKRLQVFAGGQFSLFQAL
ncbi:MAG: hypothetical protein RLZZ502_953 [Pseudomonadota bacterium]|jgi:hypothetical protein